MSYLGGKGVAKDPNEAVRWYRKAAEQGVAIAQVNLGLMYANGNGVLKDEIEALAWYNISAIPGKMGVMTKTGNRTASTPKIAPNLQ